MHYNLQNQNSTSASTEVGAFTLSKGPKRSKENVFCPLIYYSSNSNTEEQLRCKGDLRKISEILKKTKLVLMLKISFKRVFFTINYFQCIKRTSESRNISTNIFLPLHIGNGCLNLYFFAWVWVMSRQVNSDVATTLLFDGKANNDSS